MDQGTGQDLRRESWTDGAGTGQKVVPPAWMLDEDDDGDDYDGSIDPTLSISISPAVLYVSYWQL
jgi:hypothetical protein